LGRNLQQTREKRGWTQLQVTHRTGISPPQLQRLEAGQIIAFPEQAEALRQLYGIAVLEAQNLTDSSEIRRRSGINPYRLEAGDPQPWKTARADWARKTKLAPEIWDWMSQFLPADSARECSGLAQCAAAEAKPSLGNPHQWGFDLRAVVDRQGKLLGARVLPGPSYSKDDVDLVIWPQVCLRIDDRHFRKGRKRLWLILEFDGEGHNFNRDAYRSIKIGLPEIRITGEEIKRGQTFALLLQRAEEAN